MKSNLNPLVRFKNYKEEWKDSVLSDLATFSKGSGYSKSDLVEAGHPILLYGQLYTNYKTIITFVNNYVNQKEKSVLSVGDEIVVPASGETSEEIARASAITTPNIIIGGDLNIIRPIEKINSIFLALSLSHGETHNNLKKMAQGKSVVHLHNSAIKKIRLRFPSMKEQIEIGLFFKNLDDVISLQQQELEALNQTKLGFIQKMFPRKNRNNPEIRFFESKKVWRQKQFGDVLKSHSYKPYLAEICENGIYPVIQQGDNSVVGLAKGEPFENYNGVVLFGDHTVSIYKPKSPFFVATDAVKILSIDDFNGDFFKSLLERYRPKSQGYKRHYTILKKESFCYPAQSEEQVKIGEFFRQLDEVIELKKKEVELLKKMKKGFLQKMFV